MTASLLTPELLAGLANLELVARTAVDGFLSGLHRSLRHGMSVEFADVRAYTPGDDPRFIDWNAYARSNRLVLKRFQGETTAPLMLLLDASASMGFGSAGMEKLAYARFLTAALAHVAARQHDAVGLLIFDDRIREYVPPASRQRHLWELYRKIEAAAPSPSRGRDTDLRAALERWRYCGRSRGLLAVVSDFYCDPCELLRTLRPLAYRGQDVILFHLLDPLELAPRLSASTVLVDMETDASMPVSADFAERDYPERIQAHIDQLERAAAEAGADYVLLDTAQPLCAALRRYLLFRQRRG